MLFSLSVAAALGAALSWGIGDFFIQRSTRRLGNVETLAWIGLLGSLILLPFVWNDLRLLLTRSNFLTLLVLGIITFAVGLANFEALRRGKLAVVEVLLQFELPLTVLLGVFFFREVLSGLQMLLIAAVFIGVVLIAVDPREFRQSRRLLEKGAVLAIITAIGYGFINFLTAVGAKEISPLLVIWFPWVVFTVICAAWLAGQGRIKNALRRARDYPALIAIVGVVDTLAWLLFAVAVSGKELAVTIAITESYPAVSLVLAFLVNKERIGGLQMAGLVLAIFASVAVGLLS